MSVIVCTANPEAFREFVDALGGKGHEVLVAETGQKALDMVGNKAPKIVVVDEGLPDHAPLPLVEKLLMVNAMINTAVVSSLSEEDFHEASEGLGVLTRLQQNPGADEAARMHGLLAGLPDFP